MDNYDVYKRGISDQYNFYAAIQRHGESCTQFAARLRALAAKCNFEDPEDELHYRFVMGLLPGPERSLLFTVELSQPLTFARAVEFVEGVKYTRGPKADHTPRPASKYSFGSPSQYTFGPPSQYTFMCPAEHSFRCGSEYSCGTGSEYSFRCGSEYSYGTGSEYSYAPGSEYSYAPSSEYSYAPCSEYSYAPCSEYSYAPSSEYSFGAASDYSRGATPEYAVPLRTWAEVPVPPPPPPAYASWKGIVVNHDKGKGRISTSRSKWFRQKGNKTNLRLNIFDG